MSRNVPLLKRWKMEGSLFPGTIPTLESLTEKNYKPNTDAVMRVVIQRVSRASVTINGILKSVISNGLLVFVGIEDADSKEDIAWISGKIAGLRIFNDEHGVMNLSLKETGGDVLLISQFTLHAATKKGNRPSYIKAAKPDIAVPLYKQLILEMEKQLGKIIQTGEFGADMKVDLLNDGPVTIVMDSKNKE
jgi:D-tyrosyl-tRNA(Tyr) deacylase